MSEEIQPAAGRPLAVYDLCDTLYDMNTTVEFVRHYQSAHPNPHVANSLRRWTTRGSPWFYVGALASRLFGRDLARRRIIGALAGESRSQLMDSAREFVRSVLPERANRALMERLEAHREAGDRVMILSSSLDLVVAEVASLLGVDYRASTLRFDGEHCTGRLGQDLTGRKAEVIRGLLRSSRPIHVYTDNRSDRDLIEVADHATIVIPRGKPVEHWGRSGCEYVQL